MNTDILTFVTVIYWIVSAACVLAALVVGILMTVIAVTSEVPARVKALMVLSELLEFLLLSLLFCAVPYYAPDFAREMNIPLLVEFCGMIALLFLSAFVAWRIMDNVESHWFKVVQRYQTYAKS